MAARKKTAKKKTAKKKVAVRKKIGKKKTAGKPAAARKKTAKKKATVKKSVTKKKKMPSKKKIAKKKATTKKTAKKAPVKKKAGTAKKKVVKKPARKKTAAGKSTVKKSRKAVSRPTKSAEEKPDFVPYQRRKNEEYMSAEQLEHFREILTNWKNQLLDEVNRTVSHMKEDASNFADPADRATQEEEFGLELRTRDRERKLIRKINAALLRIDEGTYGYCEETGEEIGIQRLEARPVATLCLEAQERHEMRERQFRDVEDRDR
jgi:DnaK suppressor protein